MTTIANQKFSEMVQLEFQNSGSSGVSAMLLQPLLEKTSTYVCELTDLQCSLNEELAFPENRWLMTIVRKPVIPTQNIANNRVNLQLRIDLLEQYIKDYNHQYFSKAFQDYDIFGQFWADETILGDQSAFDNWQQDTFLFWAYDNSFDDQFITFEETKAGEDDDDLLDPQLTYYQDENPFKYEELVVKTKRYFSALDLIKDVAHQIDVWDTRTDGDHQNPIVPGYQHTQQNIIAFDVDPSGRLCLNVSPEFRVNYMILFSDLFQELAGFPEILYWSEDNQAVASEVFTIANLRTLQEPTFGDDAPDEWEEEVEGIAINLYGGALTVRGRNFFSTKHSIYDGFDVRKVLAVEVSLPIPHTLAWNGISESTRYVLQEFQIPGGSLVSKYRCATAALDAVTQMVEKQKIGPDIFLNGGSNMALKKMFEGQLQAIRVDLVLHYDDWDNIQKKFVRKQKRLDMAPADFFYLKLLFTKETL